MASYTVDVLTDKFRRNGYVSNSGNSDYATNGGLQRDTQAFLEDQSGLSTNGTYDPNAHKSVASQQAGISSSAGVASGGSDPGISGPSWKDVPSILSLAYLDPANVFNAQQADIAREFTRSERESAQAFSSAEAVKAYERELAADSTRYQRLMADLQSAGINPLYAFGSGGASAGSVSSSPASVGSSSGGSGAKAGTSSAQVLSSIVATLGKIAITLM